jgi:hypothetical protein
LWPWHAVQPAYITNKEFRRHNLYVYVVKPLQQISPPRYKQNVSNHRGRKKIIIKKGMASHRKHWDSPKEYLSGLL